MDQSSQINTTLGAWRALTPLGKATVVVCCLTALALLWQAATTTLALARLPDVRRLSDAERGSNASAYEQAQERYAGMLDGRSMFVKPPRPRRERLPVIPVETEEPEEEAPTTYGGPKIIAMVGEQVWFDDDTRLSVGENSGSLEVVSVRSPWTARLRWRGEVFTERLFDREGSAIPLLPLPEDETQEGEADKSTETDSQADTAAESDAEEQDGAEAEEAATGNTADESDAAPNASALDEE